MKPHRIPLAIVTASAVALSLLPAVAGAQEDTATPTVTTTVEKPADQWPGSAEGSSMLLDGDLPPAPEFGSSQFGSSSEEKDAEDDEDEDTGLVDDDGNIPVVGSVSLPGWVAIPLGIAQAFLAITSFMAQAAYAILPLMPNGTEMLRDWLRSVGINPDA
ncbi:hypothetical protein CFAEC_09205 [Corynebacterium faecale]|uniref:hypothetical protein n=1 Tax=Corynebacterium faecale TaxID=1758466 RepID=UPI0025B45502|nr:hypothetical protein [Corynebacterium faecale]WJY92658.1 hypothetical protein CFAEC_09205 [Corynebacterium faecale]